MKHGNKIIFCIFLLFSTSMFFSCLKSDFYTLTEDEVYLINLKSGVLDTPSLTLQNLPEEINFISSYTKGSHYFYEFEILSTALQNERAIKFQDDYSLVFEAAIQDYNGIKVSACSISSLKVVLPNKEIAVPVSDTVTIQSSKLNFAQDMMFKDIVRGQKSFKVVIVLETLSSRRIKLVPSAPESEHLKSECISVSYVPHVKPDSSKTVNITFLDYDDNVFASLTGIPGTPLELSSVPEKEGYQFLAWQNLPANFPEYDATYKAECKVQTFIIQYVLGGGVNSAGNPSTFTMYTPTFYLYPAERLGYAFNGWYKTSYNSGGKTVYRDRFTKIVQGTKEDIILYAKFVPKVSGGYIALNTNDIELHGGESGTLEATVSLSDGSEPDVVWTSEDEDVVTLEPIDNKSCRVIANNVTEKKSIKISAAHSDLEAYCLVTVLP